jgi:hypothetical protein
MAAPSARLLCWAALLVAGLAPGTGALELRSTAAPLAFGVLAPGSKLASTERWDKPRSGPHSLQAPAGGAQKKLDAVVLARQSRGASARLQMSGGGEAAPPQVTPLVKLVTFLTR